MTVIECEALVHLFGTVRAVDEVSFQVQRGELFALLGPNGAGKTTTFNILTTLIKPSAGRARVLGYDVIAQQSEVRAKIGVVFQEPALDDRLTAWENLEFHAVLYRIPRSEMRRRIDQALAWAGLDRSAHRAVRTFSGGMKRRLELARALMHAPRVLFLDEPTLGLDPQGRRHLWDRITGLRREGLTVFMTTHYLEEAESSDRVGIIDAGKLVAIGEPHVLKDRVLGTTECSLEDVFLELTGRQLRDDSATPRDRLLGFARRGGEMTR
ncbi:MAG: ATP-binding cassette domain-containing protein [Firmicutes bacterium]|nr:ATP-binding cassette domain-containing protein [Bacillota bacterium]